jgi:hypothetical protein
MPEQLVKELQQATTTIPGEFIVIQRNARATRASGRPAIRADASSCSATLTSLFDKEPAG